jgi:hypothetical protein
LAAARAVPCGLVAVTAGALLASLVPWPFAAAGTGLVFLAAANLVGAAGPGGLRALAADHSDHGD